jgi:limonene 1,2-monooxygenase
LFRAHEWATREQTMRSYELFARYVMPVFQQSLDGPIGSRTWATENRKQVFGSTPEAVRRAFTDFGAAVPKDFKQRTLGGRDVT